MLLNSFGEVVDELADLGSPTEPSVEPAMDEGAKLIARAPIGDCFVVKRVLSSVEKESDTSQRTNLFNTRCIIEGKICTIIIDGGSCCNIIS